MKQKSRTVRGFHRLGVVLAVPLLLGAFGVAVSAWFSTDGPIIADPTVEPPLPVTLAPMGQVAPALLANPRYSRWKANRSMPPASSRAGITRYEVWRLPPAEEGGVGLVSLAVVADMTGLVDTFRQIDDGIERWRESLE
jgi:hypothetical protein